MKLAAILLGTVVLVFASASLALPENKTSEGQEVTTNVPDLNSTCIDCEPLDFAQSEDIDESDDESEEEVDGETEIDGIKLKNLSPTEFYALIIDDDNIVRSELGMTQQYYSYHRGTFITMPYPVSSRVKKSDLCRSSLIGVGGPHQNFSVGSRDIGEDCCFSQDVPFCGHQLFKG